MFCTNCGKEIKDGSTFCVYCGTKIAEEVGNKTEQPEKKKAALKLETAVSSVLENRTDKETDIEKIKQIVGKNAEYYLKQFESIHQTGKGKLNWAAFFLGPFHVGYRNNWKGWWKTVRIPALCMLGIGILAGIISFFQMIIGMVLISVMEIFMIWMGIAQILYALHFNKIYMQHVEQKAAENNLKTDTSIGRGILTYIGFFAVYMIMIGISTSGIFYSIFSRNVIDDWDTDIEDYMEDFEASELNDIMEQLLEDIENDMDFDDDASLTTDNSFWTDDTYQSAYDLESNDIIKEDEDTIDVNTYLGTLYSVDNGDGTVVLYMNDANNLCVSCGYGGEPGYSQIYDTYEIEDGSLYGYAGETVDEFIFEEGGLVMVLLAGEGSGHYQSYIREYEYWETDWQKELGFE